MKRIAILSIALVVALWSSAQAGRIAPDLYAQLDLLAPGDYISTLVMLEDQVDLETLNQELDNMQATRAYRHERVIRALMHKAMETQGDLLLFLDEKASEGRVVEHKPVWIANMVLVTAPKRVIERLAERADVGEIYIDYEIENIKPVSASKASEGLITSIEEGLERINAPAAWARGYTGRGRLVSSLDTGVDGNHVVFASRWRGNHAPSSECWYDPVTNTNFPFDSGEHGTHTMGTICGYKVATDDHIGVAYDAEWITAGVIDRVSIPVTMSDAVTAFEWTADPDGNPATVDDVPDVSSNSWGISPIYHGSYLNGACDQVFWSVLDGCEAAGVVVVFAAGNEGNSPTNSIRNPANRSTTIYNSFSVGAIDGSDYGNYPAAWFTSWGPAPSNCGPYTTKPEVAAPGVHVRSSVPGGGFMYMDGTSMATPHVAGAVAIIRQVDPNTTSDEVKAILMDNAQDLGNNGEDNTYGWGLIDLDAAITAMTAGCWWELTCSPVGAPITIPPEGGTFSFDAFITNHCAVTRLTDVWTMVELPNGNPFGPGFMHEAVSFSADETKGATGFSHYVPAEAPAGVYTYKVLYGSYPAVKDSCFFTFEKLSVAGGGSYDQPQDFSGIVGGGDGDTSDLNGTNGFLSVRGWDVNDFAAE